MKTGYVIFCARVCIAGMLCVHVCALQVCYVCVCVCTMTKTTLNKMTIAEDEIDNYVDQHNYLCHHWKGSHQIHQTELDWFTNRN